MSETLEEMVRQGIASSVIAVSPLHRPRKTALPSSEAKWMRYPQIPGTLGLSSAGRFLHRRLLARVEELHKGNRIDIIHAHAALPCGHAAMLLAGQLQIPFVVTLHGLDVFNSCFLSGRPAEWRRRASVEVYREARAVICVSGKVEEVVLVGMREGARTRIVYNGTDTKLFCPANRAMRGDKEILIVANLIRDKGHELVLRAMGRMQSKWPDLRCRIIGEGPDRERLRALAQSLGIAARVNFAGSKSRAEVAAAMRACTLLALPSRCEGLGCVYLEAMACGKPVIACHGQGIEEIIENGRNGWLIPVDGLAELEERLQVLLDSPELCERIGAAARETIVSKLTLSHQARELMKVYDEAIQ